jgi:hypothetical protein
MDSSDKYTAENKGTVEMVKEWREGLGMHTRLVRTKSIMYWFQHENEEWTF